MFINSLPYKIDIQQSRSHRKLKGCQTHKKRKLKLLYSKRRKVEFKLVPEKSKRRFVGK